MCGPGVCESSTSQPVGATQHKQNKTQVPSSSSTVSKAGFTLFTPYGFAVTDQKKPHIIKIILIGGQLNVTATKDVWPSQKCFSKFSERDHWYNAHPESTNKEDRLGWCKTYGTATNSIVAMKIHKLKKISLLPPAHADEYFCLRDSVWFKNFSVIIFNTRFIVRGSLNQHGQHSSWATSNLLNVQFEAAN